MVAQAHVVAAPAAVSDGRAVAAAPEAAVPRARAAVRVLAERWTCWHRGGEAEMCATHAARWLLLPGKFEKGQQPQGIPKKNKKCEKAPIDVHGSSPELGEAQPAIGHSFSAAFFTSASSSLAHTRRRNGRECGCTSPLGGTKERCCSFVAETRSTPGLGLAPPRANQPTSASLNFTQQHEATKQVREKN